MAITDDQRDALLGLLGGSSPAHFQQAVELVEALDDPDLWAELSAAFQILGDGTLSIGAPYKDTVSSDHIWPLLLRVLQRTGRLSRLVALDLEGLEVGPLGVLAPCAALRILKLPTTEFNNDPAPLAVLTGLEELEFDWEDEMPDIHFLAGLTRMKRLKIVNCEILADVSAVANMTALETLNFHACGELADISPLAGLTELVELDLSETAVTDLTPLVSLKKLRRLQLSDCEDIVSLEPLHAMSSLRELVLHKIDVPTEEQEALKQALPQCKIDFG